MVDLFKTKEGDEDVRINRVHNRWNQDNGRHYIYKDRW